MASRRGQILLTVFCSMRVLPTRLATASTQVPFHLRNLPCIRNLSEYSNHLIVRTWKKTMEKKKRHCEKTKLFEKSKEKKKICNRLIKSFQIIGRSNMFNFYLCGRWGARFSLVRGFPFLPGDHILQRIITGRIRCDNGSLRNFRHFHVRIRSGGNERSLFALLLLKSRHGFENRRSSIANVLVDVRRGNVEFLGYFIQQRFSVFIDVVGDRDERILSLFYLNSKPEKKYQYKNQSINQSIEQSNNQPINQSHFCQIQIITNQSINRTINQSINQPINQSHFCQIQIITNQSIKRHRLN